MEEREETRWASWCHKNGKLVGAGGMEIWALANCKFVCRILFTGMISVHASVCWSMCVYIGVQAVRQIFKAYRENFSLAQQAIEM